MDFKVFLSQEALNDLERIVAYIAFFNPQAAQRVGDQLVDAAMSLQNLPERGRIVPEHRDLNVREIIVRSYRIIYRVGMKDKVVEVVRFWHGARGFPHIPRME